MNLVYLDQAATSWPKPPAVLRAAENAMITAGGNPGRGAHPLSEAAEELVYACREEAAEMFCTVPERVVFTAGATHALNTAIRGLVTPGSHILCDNFCHNAVRRCVLALVNEGIASADHYDASGTEEETLDSLEENLRPETTLVIATHQSNICSKTLPVERIADFCTCRGLFLVIDAAQSGGRLPVSMKKLPNSAVCLPGHKGLCGPAGVGMLLLSKEMPVRPLLFGGAGIASLDRGMPEELPERLEAGTLPVPAIAGLLAGMRHVRALGIDAIRAWEESLAAEFTAGLGRIGGFALHGETRGSTVSFTHPSRSPAKIGTALAERGICVRTGLHCAPAAHRTLGTESSGTVRVSFGASNTRSDVAGILKALASIV